MNSIAITDDFSEFIRWTNLYNSGRTSTFPLFDPRHQFVEFLYYESIQIRDSLESTDPKPVAQQTSKILFVVKGSSFHPFAGFAANMLFARVIELEHLDEIPGHLHNHVPSFALLLIEPSEIEHDFYEFYYKEMVTRCPSGLILARSVEHLSWLLIKSRLQYGTKGHLALLPRSKDRYTPTSDTTILTSADQMYEQMIPLLKHGYLESFYISTHGSEDVLMLSDAVVCGKSRWNQPKGLTCELGETCNFGNAGVTPYDIKSRFVFSNTCMGLRVNQTFLPLDASMSLTFLENHAAVYVSSNMVKYGPDAELCLLYNFMLHGFSVGDSVRWTNLWIEQSEIDFPSFVVIGDPSLHYSYTRIMNASTEWIHSRILDVNMEGQTFVEIPLTKELADQNLYLSATTEQKLYFAKMAEPDGSNPRLYLYAWEPIKTGSIRIQFHTGDDVQLLHARFSTQNWLSGLQRHVVGKKLHKEVPNLHNQIDRIAMLMQDLSYDLSAYKRVVHAVNKLTKTLSKIQIEMIEKLLKRATTVSTIWMPDSYLEMARMKVNKFDQFQCYVCQTKSRQVHFEHRLTKENRQVMYCPRCGGISDSPEHAVLTFSIRGVNENPITDPMDQIIVIENHSPETIEGYAGIRLESTQILDLVVEPSMIHFQISPGERMEYSVRFDLQSNMVPHLYYLKGILVHNLDLYYTNKPVFLKHTEK